jgi:hypothetical protein
MPEFPYKSQVKIVVATMALHNYIQRKSGKDVAFNEFDNHPDFVPPYTFPDVVPQSQPHGHQRASRMDYIRDDITCNNPNFSTFFFAIYWKFSGNFFL